MSISLLNILGFYEDSIDKAFDQCAELLEYLYLKEAVDNIEDNIQKKLPDEFDWDNPTGSIITCMFDITEDIITNAYPDIEVTTCINGYASDIYINEEIQDLKKAVDASNIEDKAYTFKRIFSSNLYEEMDISNIKELLNDTGVLEDVLDSMEAGNSFCYYDSVEELGEDNNDSDLYEEDDDNESFGNFLIQAYKNGNSNTIYYVFSNGCILAMNK